MPLTALGPDGGLLDATSCDDGVWSALYRTRPRVALTCRSCGAAMHAKVSSSGLRFFAHDRLSPTCPSNGETPAHHQLKTLLAEAIRAAGSTAIVEATPDPGDRGGWRADVLAVTADGRRVAFEAQLAKMTVTDGDERTRRYAADGIDTVWVTTRGTPWLFRLPAIKVETADGADVVRRGCVQLDELTPLEKATWRIRADVALGRFVAGVLAGRIVATTLDTTLYDSRPWGTTIRYLHHRQPVAFVPAEHLDRQRRHDDGIDARRERMEAERAREEARRAANIEALYERQRRALPAAVADAAGREWVWAGIPATRVGATIEPRDAAGGPRYAHGGVLWVGPNKRALRAVAVVCPVASRLNAAKGQQWAQREIAVYAENQTEAARLAKALAWPVDRIRVPGR